MVAAIKQDRTTTTTKVREADRGRNANDYASSYVITNSPLTLHLYSLTPKYVLSMAHSLQSDAFDGPK